MKVMTEDKKLAMSVMWLTLMFVGSVVSVINIIFDRFDGGTIYGYLSLITFTVCTHGVFVEISKIYKRERE